MLRILFLSSRSALKHVYIKINFHKFLNVHHLHNESRWGSAEITDINFSHDKNISVMSQSTIDMKVNEKPATINYDKDLQTLLSEMTCNYFDEQYFTNCDCFGDSNLCSLYNLSSINYQTISDSYSYPGKNAMNIYISISKNVDENFEDREKKTLLTFPEKDLMQINAVLPKETINYNDVIDAKDFFSVYNATDLKKDSDEEETIVENSFQWDGSCYNKKWVCDFSDPNDEGQFQKQSSEADVDEFDEFPLENLVLEESTLENEVVEDVIYSDLAAEFFSLITNPYAGNNGNK